MASTSKAMSSIFDLVSARRGHFLLESGYHTDLWFDLDALFHDPQRVAPYIEELAELLTPFAPTAICGPLLGGAFLAQAVATHLRIHFYHSEPAGKSKGEVLFAAEYRLPAALQRLVSSARVAIVDDVVSAGSSVRATRKALDDAGAKVVAVGALAILGDAAVQHFVAAGIPLVSTARESFSLWTPGECGLCSEGVRLEQR